MRNFTPGHFPRRYQLTHGSCVGARLRDMKKTQRSILRAAAAAPLAICVLAAPVAAHGPQDEDVSHAGSADVANDLETSPDSMRWDFELDFGFSGAVGNSDYAVVTSGFTVEHLQTDSYEFAWSGSLRYGEGEEGVIARAMKGSFSFALVPASRWSPFVYTTVERDIFRRVAVRTNAGAGVNYDLIDEPRAAASLSATLLHDYKNFADPSGVSPLANETNARWSLRAESRRSLGGGAALDNTTWLKAVPGAPDDYDLDSTTKVSVPLSEHVGLKVTYTLKRDSTPPPDVDENDQLLQVGVTVGF